ncbi:hypothetical protein SAMN05518846_105176 [Brevibacillus centrosporus]|uniref:Uncharacterized protein n=1 Tax=Brevibacillus centrosporus TaxID=54910 RepID=A0A1I3TYB3_9BACL|nr:hypothetical protein SAMN05518846_105176 [Brevibacillus centrosporus]
MYYRYLYMFLYGIIKTARLYLGSLKRDLHANFMMDYTGELSGE